MSNKNITVTYSVSHGRTGLQKKGFKNITSYKMWEKTMSGLITVIMVEERK